MTSDCAKLLHLSDALRHREASRLTHLFELHLRGAAPALANAVTKAAAELGAPTVHIITSALIAASEPRDSAQSVQAFDKLRHAARIAPRQDALLGQALVSALAGVLGDEFRGAIREAWLDGYIHLVEIVMANRSNRFELVA